MKSSAKPVILVLISAGIVCCAGGSSLQTKLVRKWNNPSAKTIGEFKSDGTVQVMTPIS